MVRRTRAVVRGHAGRHAGVVVALAILTVGCSTLLPSATPTATPTPEPTEAVATVTATPMIGTPTPSVVIINPTAANDIVATARPAIANVGSGATPQPGVATGGVIVVGAPGPSATVGLPSQPANGVAPTVVVDELRGLAAIPSGASLVSIPRGDSSRLRLGDQGVFLTSPESRPIVGSFLDVDVVAAGTTGLGRVVLVFTVPPDADIQSGIVLDASGRLLGVLSSDRRAPPPPGQVYVVPVEQLEDLIRRADPGSRSSMP